MKLLRRVIASDVGTSMPGGAAATGAPAASIPESPVAATPPAAEGVQSTVTTNAKGMRFLTLYGNTFPIKDKLKEVGFRYFKGSWSKPVDFIKPGEREMLAGLGVDCSPLDAPAAPPVSAEPDTAPASDGLRDMRAKSPATDRIEAFKKKIEEEAAGDSTAGGKAKAMLGFVEKSLERLAKSTDETAKSEFIRHYLELKTRFHSYSFANTMMIYFQNPEASYVKGHAQWLRMGRQVVNWKNGISILAPSFRTYKDRADVDPSTGQPKEHAYVRFMPVQVFDVADTQPIPGWKDKEGHGPFEPVALKSDAGESNEDAEALTQAAAKFAGRLGIRTNLEARMPNQMGGVSRGGDVAINSKYRGIAQFSTTVHELAHETLHWVKDQPDLSMDAVARTRMRREEEIEAESVAYAVLKHYGFESQDAPNYLALWRATERSIKSRLESISNAVRVIVRGIDEEMSRVSAPDDGGPSVTASDWYGRSVVASD